MGLFRVIAQNMKGRDFAAGDIHGCFAVLDRLLLAVAFDPTVDRLFLLGDLVDRGPHSERFAEFLAQPWVFSVRGNHDQMMLEAATNLEAARDWRHNGGDWIDAFSEEQVAAWRALIETLPLAMEVATPNGLVGLVHADVNDLTWPEFREIVQLMVPSQVSVHNRAHRNSPARHLFVSALWSRQLAEEVAYEAQNRKDPYPTCIEGVHALVIGHTSFLDVKNSGNVWAIDTGAGKGHPKSALTLLNLHTFETHSLPVAP